MPERGLGAMRDHAGIRWRAGSRQHHSTKAARIDNQCTRYRIRCVGSMAGRAKDFDGEPATISTDAQEERRCKAKPG